MKFQTYVHKIVLDHQPNYKKDPCKDARAQGENACTCDKTCLRAFMTSALIYAPIFMHIVLVVNYYPMNLSLKFHKDLSLR